MAQTDYQQGRASGRVYPCSSIAYAWAAAQLAKRQHDRPSWGYWLGVVRSMRTP